MFRQILQCTKLLLTVYSTAQYFWVLLYYIHPVQPSGTQCYKMSGQILQCSALQILAAAIARTYRLSQTNSLLWRNGLECTRNSHFHQMLTLSSSVLPSLPGSYDKSQTWVVVFSILEIQIFNCLSETLSKIWNIYGGLLCLSPWMKIFLQKVNSTYPNSQWVWPARLVLENHFRTSLSRQLL